MIAAAGVTSRRKAEELIVEGRVTVNGKTVTRLGTKVDPFSDRIEVDDNVISGKGARKKTYILLNKPKGVISALIDPEGRPVVTDLLKRIKGRVYPVGRLDYDAEGALLLTNDGDLANKLIHPRYSVSKRYHVKVRGVPDEKKLHRLATGVSLEDGRTLPAKSRLINKTNVGENSWIELTVTEGRNRLVKRMCQKVGHPVQKLKRISFAGIGVKGLKLGEFRFLTPAEIQRLKELA